MSDICLSGFTPTGRLHLGHYVGAVRNAVLRQDEKSIFLIANVHAYTTRAEDPEGIKKDTLDLARDLIACGVDTSMSYLVVQSMVPEIAELATYLSMLIPFNKVMRNPTINDEINVKGLGDQYPFGFPLYAVGQCADILIFRANKILVGEDQKPLIDMSRDTAKKFNAVYCGVNPQLEDEAAVESGGVFPIPEAQLVPNCRLLGIDGKQKMSKSLGNAIFLHESPDEVRRKVMKIFTGRQAKTDPGDIHNVLMQYVRCFIGDPRAQEIEGKYATGDNIGEGEIKEEVAEAINKILAPIHQRLDRYDDTTLSTGLRMQSDFARKKAQETIGLVRNKMKLVF